MNNKPQVIKSWWGRLGDTGRVLIIVVPIFIIIWVCNADQRTADAENDRMVKEYDQRHEAKEVVKSAKNQNLFQAYGTACSFLKNKYPGAEHLDMEYDKCVDYGNGIYAIVGKMDFNGYGYRWAAEVQKAEGDIWNLTQQIAIEKR